MTSADAFVRTILDEPDADAPRLVYADWLEERGDPLAELIRVQCALARLGFLDRRGAGLRERERQLLADNLAGWMGPVQQLGLEGVFRRGMLELNVTGTKQLLASERLFGLPWILQVNLSDGAAAKDDLARLTQWPHFARIQALDLTRSHIGNDGLVGLCESPFRCRPTILRLNQIKVSTSGLRLFTERMDLSRLKELRLTGNELGAAGALALSACSRLSQLRVLHMANNHIGTVGGEYLAESPFLDHLLTLNVRGNSIGPRGKKALLRRFGPRVQIGAAEHLP
jgi:uncharacterized protein (TIGR02996 family)